MPGARLYGKINFMTELIDLRTKQKIAAFDKWMNGDHVLVHLDSRGLGVEVPEFLSAEPALTLKLSYHFQGEVTRNDTNISAYLKFSGSYHRCVIPWTAIWGITSETKENVMWNEDMPKEVLLRAGQEKLREIGRKLFGIGEKGDESPAPNAAKAAPKEKKAASHLKRIK